MSTNPAIQSSPEQLRAPEELSASMTMAELESAVPSARRTLFTHYHLGGCNACAYDHKETIAALCQRSEIDPAELLSRLADAAATDAMLSISPAELKEELSSANPPQLIDIRTREEHEAVRIEGSAFFDEELQQRLMNSGEKDAALVLYDHQGTRALDAAAYYAGHGFSSVRALTGGIDAWSEQINQELPRYRLERS